MNLDQITIGDIVEIEPPTTTCWDRPSKNNNIGDVNQGEQYRVHKTHAESGLIELDEPTGGWPSSLHPLSYGGVWIDPRFVRLAGTLPPPPPPPVVAGDGSLKSLAARLGQTLLDWSAEQD